MVKKKQVTGEHEIETELDALKAIAEELKKLRKEIESLNMQIGMQSVHDSTSFYRR